MTEHLTDATAEAAAKSLRAAAGASARVQPLQLDVASRSSIAAAVQQLRAEYDQRLDCLVNNAGVNTVGIRLCYVGSAEGHSLGQDGSFHGAACSCVGSLTAQVLAPAGVMEPAGLGCGVRRQL